MLIGGGRVWLEDIYVSDFYSTPEGRLPDPIGVNPLEVLHSTRGTRLYQSQISVPEHWEQSTTTRSFEHPQASAVDPRWDIRDMGIRCVRSVPSP
jgi:hypothetical protein